jgi:hypothetical protein
MLLSNVSIRYTLAIHQSSKVDALRLNIRFFLDNLLKVSKKII